jgi:predicted ATPase
LFTLLEAKSFKCIRYVKQPLRHFQILVGPNASGKSTFLDIIAFISDLQRDGLEKAILKRARNAEDVTWNREGGNIELAVEIELPKDGPSSSESFSKARYELRIEINGKGEAQLTVENLWLLRNGATLDSERNGPSQRRLFPEETPVPKTIVVEQGKHTPPGRRKVMSRAQKGRIYVKSEVTDWNIQLGQVKDRAGLMAVPEDKERFPATVWIRKFLSEGIQEISLNYQKMRMPCSPIIQDTFLPDGSNLPIVMQNLKDEQKNLWIEHLQVVLPEIMNIGIREREEDRYRYLEVETRSGLRLPSWLLSDGTLRFLALTLIAYLDEPGGIFLIEEPENGIHPQAIEAVYQSLSSVYRGQVLCATHSPIFLSLAEPEVLLCFAKNESGSTDVVRGDQHPKLKYWRNEVDLGSLLASGILG